MPSVRLNARRRAWAQLPLALGLAALPAWSSPAHADTFIRRFLAAHGGCSFELGFVLTGSALQAPFDKAAARWTEADLATLTHELEACQSEAHAAGNPVIAAEVDRFSRAIAERVPELVRQARAEAQRQKAQLTARAESASAATRQSVDDLAQLKSQVDAAETQATNTQIQAKLAIQALQLRKQNAEANSAKAKADVARLKDETERRERAAAQAEADRAAAARHLAETDKAGQPDEPPQSQGGEVQNAPIKQNKQAQVQTPNDDEATGPPPIRMGDRVAVKRGYVACRELRDLDRVRMLDDARDLEAAADYALDRDCRAVPTGTTLVVERFSLIHGAYCVRPYGEADCAWIPTASLMAEGG